MIIENPFIGAVTATGQRDPWRESRHLHQFSCPPDCELDHTEPDDDARERALDEVLDADERDGIRR